MKALEILKELHSKDIHDLMELNIDHVNVYEAIAELEEAMKPKECSKCKHIHQGWWCNENGIRVTLDFGCNRYEPKEQ